MNITPIKTRSFLPPKDSLDDLLHYFDNRLTEGCIITISSKVLSICVGNCIPADEYDKQKLQEKESSKILSRRSNHNILLTKKDDMLVEYGGVDTLAAGYYSLLPKKPYKLAKQIWKKIRKEQKIKKLGVIITYSHSVPFRNGAIGIAVAGYGFKPVADYRTKNGGKAHADLIDGLAAAANLVIGEAANHTPICVIKHPPDIKYFTKIMPASIMRSYMYVRKDEVYNMF